jgi:ribonuclease BN (tRNA processing enzyme)
LGFWGLTALIKNSTEISEMKAKKALRSTEREKAEAGFAAGPHELNVHILAGSTIDASPAVIVTTRNERSARLPSLELWRFGDHIISCCFCFRYLINASSGVQRMCVQHKVKVTKLTRILLTNLDSSCVSGLPGLIMTMADGGRAEGHVVGPPGLKAFERAVRPFMHRNFFALRMDEVVGEALTFPDSVTVTAAAVHSPTSPQAPAEPAEEPADHAASPVKRRRIESPSSEPSSAPLSVPSSASAPFVPLGHAPGSLPACDVSYVFAVPAQRGRFDAASADALGVPAGRLRGQLHAGRPITLDNGTVILPAQVPLHNAIRDDWGGGGDQSCTTSANFSFSAKIRERASSTTAFIVTV